MNHRPPEAGSGGGKDKGKTLFSKTLSLHKLLILAREQLSCILHPQIAALFSLNSIQLLQFRNYPSARFSFGGRVTGICGKNGVGKTNLLDAIYYSCFTRSYFSRSDLQLVQQGSQGFRLDAELQCRGEEHRFSAILRETGKKELNLNGEPLSRSSQYIGRFPVVMVCPDDTLLITGTSEERRRFMDVLFAQLDPQYLRELSRYTKLITQRNSYLKQAAETGQFDGSLLDVYDTQMAEAGEYVYKVRKAGLAELLPLIQKQYEQIAGRSEGLQSQYQSPLSDTSFLSLLRANREKDRLLQRTRTGIHRDEIDWTLGGQPFRQVSSQGQRKSLLFACKLSEFELLKKAKGFPPLLLLDDVFEKLDEERMHNLLETVCVQNTGQVFITDTHEERISRHFDQLGIPVQLLKLGN